MLIIRIVINDIMKSSQKTQRTLLWMFFCEYIFIWLSYYDLLQNVSPIIEAGGHSSVMYKSQEATSQSTSRQNIKSRRLLDFSLLLTFKISVSIPDKVLRGWGHPWHHELSWYVILYLCAKFQLSSMIRSVSRTPVLELHTGRMSIVLYLGLVGWGQRWQDGSSWYVILYLCTKFQLSSMNRS